MTSDQAPASTPPPATLVAWLHVTNAISLRCSYCYIKKSGESMSPAIGRAAIDATFRSNLNAGYQRVDLKCFPCTLCPCALCPSLRLYN